MGQASTSFQQSDGPVLPHSDPDDPQAAGAMPSDDEFFIRKTLEQEPERGVELLYSRYFQPLCTHTVRFVGSREVAEDLVSEIFYQFYTEQIFQKITSSYRAYLFKTARNRAYNYLRWELSRKMPLEETDHPNWQESQLPDAITQYEELYQDVEKALNTLPIQRRKIYLLHQFEGKRFKEIAGELQISVRTVEVQIYRASKAIRQLLKEKWLISILFGLFLPK
ncbi:RNA polymerase sigma factor [Larkinella rosea]|uniref:Sigma-70 family RNA polymerase sigma factor n=1 Tax=Larkinella rosea TaxID=2025312 RepID=A0A3P1BRJ1_9BACT|nr:sigma-70 family RNA polymerase sigma factor [Larkinella rosea]RRB03690.1 sigma-70 family RNA polymerase sigma factor [Larkinella rosea]